MTLNEAPYGERLHIGFFGKRNAGKSSLVNAVTGQNMAVVSEIKGTTTDPVKKSMELLPLGPVVIIDTPGFDDEGELGKLRVGKTKEILAVTDIAVLVTDAAREPDKELVGIFEARKLPYMIAYNKADLLTERKHLKKNEIYVSAKTGEGITELKQRLAAFSKGTEKRLIGDLLSPGDTVVLVIPIDEAAPKGRLILPQQMALRDILDAHAMAVTCQPEELKRALAALSEKPRLVITDSQVFKRVSSDVSEDVMITSFSILMARYKGELDTLVNGAEALGSLKDGDRVLISEGCTHHRQCGDIGTVKLPAWINSFCKAKPEYGFTSGGGFPDSLSEYKLIVHCGGCMLSEKEMKRRIVSANETPIVNYGMAIAHMNGILKRSLEIFEL